MSIQKAGLNLSYQGVRQLDEIGVDKKVLKDKNISKKEFAGLSEKDQVKVLQFMYNQVGKTKPNSPERNRLLSNINSFESTMGAVISPINSGRRPNAAAN